MFFRCNVGGIGWAIIIFIISLLPGRNLPEVEFKHIDWIVHGVVYLVLVILLLRGFLKQYEYAFLRYHAVKLVLLFGLLYGTFIEICQEFFSSGRHFDMTDIVANFIGCIVGAVLFEIFNSNLKIK